MAATLSGKPPIVIAHRGASGYLPEHTLAAYRLAIELGADFIEPDLVSTRDGVLIARHEPNLVETTNVGEVAKFADRRTVKRIDGAEQAGFFAEDFTLAEIKELRTRQPHPDRDPSHNDQYEIPTLAEILDLVRQAEAETGRRVGIYPETKHPTYFDRLGLSLEEPLIQTLVQHRFTEGDRVLIQSFEVANLREKLPRLMAAAGIRLPLVQLFEEWHLQPYDFAIGGDPRTYADLICRDSLKDFVATYAAGIGVWKRSFVLAEDSAGATRLTGEVLPVVADAHAAGLVVHPYTFRSEARFLAADYGGDPAAEYRQFFALGVDGVFSDFPDAAVAVRDRAVPIAPNS